MGVKNIETLKGHILVIDDDASIREGCERILSKQGWIVDKAQDGEEGLHLIERKQYALILLDLKMPGLSGIEVLEQAKKIKNDLIVVVISGYATVESAVEAMKNGAYDFIAKPFTPEQLRIVVKRAIEKRNLEEEARALREEREKSLRDIATEKSKLRVIVNSMGDGVLVVNAEKAIVLKNPAASKMLGLKTEEIASKTLKECLDDETGSIFLKMIADLENKRLSAISQEMQFGGQLEQFLRVHACPVKAEDEEILGTVFVLQDISHLKELDRMKSDFVAMVAHELRAPLSAMQQQLFVIEEGLLGDINEKQREVLLRVMARSNGLLTLIKNLLDLSKIEQGKIIQHKETLQLKEIAMRVKEFMAPQAKGKKIYLRLEIPKDLPLIDADPNNMEVIITNLVSNAIRYTPEGGEVIIRLAKSGEYIKIVVSDTGIGIKKEELPNIFDKFYRVKSVQTRKILGSGLGLSIVKGIVDAHLGKINVTSQPGKGTTFTILLPQKARRDKQGTI